MQKTINEKGYEKIKIKYNKCGTINKMVSNIVADAFPEICGKKTNPDDEVHHLDGIRNNDFAENLKYVSVKEHYEIHNKTNGKE